MWVGGWTELQHNDPHSYGHNSVSFPFSWAAQPGAWGPSLSGTLSSFQYLFSNWLNFLCTVLYNCSTYTFFLWTSQIALISTRPRSRLYPDIPRPDAPVIYTDAFPILTAWPGSICYTRIVVFQVEHYTIKTDIISYYFSSKELDWKCNLYANFLAIKYTSDPWCIRKIFTGIPH